LNTIDIFCKTIEHIDILKCDIFALARNNFVKNRKCTITLKML
jgi:hypothetical protein